MGSRLFGTGDALAGVTRLGDDAAPAQAHLAPGALFDGRFRIVRVLGRGGFGTVYLAIDEQLASQVAVKVLRPEVAKDARALETLVREVATARRIEHQNVLRIHHIDTKHSPHYITMEAMEGGDLLELMKQRGGRLDEDEAVRIVDGVLAGLEALHAHRVLHLDIKPQNILLTRDLQPKLGDFGLSRGLGGPGMDRSIGGTLEFASPEQSAGSTGDVRSDVYSVGMMLAYLVAGSHPFEADEKSVKAWQTSEKRRFPGLSKTLESVVAGCTAKDAGERFRTATDVRMALSQRASSTRTGPAATTRSAARRDSTPTREPAQASKTDAARATGQATPPRTDFWEGVDPGHLNYLQSLGSSAPYAHPVGDRCVPESRGTTWSVAKHGRTGFSRIQDALDAARDGDTVVVGPGCYFERLNIDKPVAVVAEVPGTVAVLAPSPAGGPAADRLAELASGATALAGSSRPVKVPKADADMSPLIPLIAGFFGSAMSYACLWSYIHDSFPFWVGIPVSYGVFMAALGGLSYWVELSAREATSLVNRFASGALAALVAPLQWYLLKYRLEPGDLTVYLCPALPLAATVVIAVLVLLRAMWDAQVRRLDQWGILRLQRKAEAIVHADESLLATVTLGAGACLHGVVVTAPVPVPIPVGSRSYALRSAGVVVRGRWWGKQTVLSHVRVDAAGDVQHSSSIDCAGRGTKVLLSNVHLSGGDVGIGARHHARVTMVGGRVTYRTAPTAVRSGGRFVRGDPPPTVVAKA